MDIATAVREAEATGRACFRTRKHGHDGDCCGFAWVAVSGCTAAQRAALDAAGFTSSSATTLIRTFDHGTATQGLSCKEAANEAAAAVARSAELTARMRSTMD